MSGGSAFAFATHAIVWIAAVALLGSAHADPAELLARGRDAAARGDHSEAVRLATDAIAEARTTLSSEDQLVVAYLENDISGWQFALGDGQLAFEFADAALRSAESQLPANDPRLGYFLVDVAARAYAAANCEASIDAYTRARSLLEARPDLVGTRLQIELDLAKTLLSYGDDEGARELLDEIVSRTDVSPALLADALAALAMQRLDALDVAAAQSTLVSAARALQAAAQAENADPTGLVGLRATILSVGAWTARMAGDLDDADRLLGEVERMLTAAGMTLSEVPIALNERANLNFYRGRFAVAESDYRALLAAYPAFSDKSLPVARASYQLAVALRALGDHAQAEIFFDRAEPGFSACSRGEPWLLAYLIVERMRLRLAVGRVADAERDATLLASLVDRMSGERPLLRAYELAARSETLAQRGRLADAVTTMTQAVDTIRSVRGERSEDLIPGYVRLAEWSLAEGRIEAARSYANSALTLRQQMGAASLWGEATAWSLLAAATDAATPQFVEAATGLVRAAETYFASAPGATELVRQELRASRDLVERALRPAAALSDALTSDRSTKALTALIQLPQLAESASVLALGDAAAASTPDEGRRLLATRATLMERRRVLGAQLEAMRTAPNVENDRNIARLVDDIGNVQRELGATDARLREVAPRTAELLVPRTIAPEEIQASLRDGEALYMQLVTRSATHGLLIRRDRIVYRVGGTQSARDLVRRSVRRLRDSLDLQLGANRTPFDVAAARALYRASLAPFAADLGDIRELVVIPDDAFQNVPWSVFRVDADGEPAPPGGAFLAERLSITSVPSASSFTLLRSEAARRPEARAPFVGFGDPALVGGVGGRAARSADALVADMLRGVDPEQVRELEPLPQTARELRALAGTLGAGTNDVFLREAATRARVKTLDLTGYRVVSFATHGLLASDFRGLGEPALVLTPEGTRADGTRDNGLLTATDIAGLRTSAELVLLSACNTGRADDGGGAYGLSALARAFFAAGAQSLVVSHWSVDSEATVLLLTKFIEIATAQKTLNKSAALHEAMRWMLSGAAGARYQDPAYWAGFVLLGDSRPLYAADGSGLTAATIEKRP